MYVPDHFIISLKSCKIVVLKVFIYNALDTYRLGPINLIKQSNPLSAELFPYSKTCAIKGKTVVMVKM